mmetsp:Transcript_5000/g.21244  ORF Transcript_5000/g.21244 Transcript_5000/m.21244 type:complete len:299 (+) Transcript_5000:2773-3669(+)
MRSIKSRFPASSNASASSSTKKRTFVKSKTPLSTRSTTRPGVPTATSHPAPFLSTSVCAFFESRPPPPPTNSAVPTFGEERCVANDSKNEHVCSASSRVGSTIRARGVRGDEAETVSTGTSVGTMTSSSSSSSSPETHCPSAARAIAPNPLGGGCLNASPLEFPNRNTHSAFFRHTAGNSAVPEARFFFFSFFSENFPKTAIGSNRNATPSTPSTAFPFLKKEMTPSSQSSAHPTTSPFAYATPPPSPGNASNAPACDFFPVPPYPHDFLSVPRASSFFESLALHPTRTRPSSVTSAS